MFSKRASMKFSPSKMMIELPLKSLRNPYVEIQWVIVKRDGSGFGCGSLSKMVMLLLPFAICWFGHLLISQRRLRTDRLCIFSRFSFWVILHFKFIKYLLGLIDGAVFWLIISSLHFWVTYNTMLKFINGNNRPWKINSIDEK